MLIAKHSFISQILTKIIIWFVAVFHFEISTMSEQAAENARKEVEASRGIRNQVYSKYGKMGKNKTKPFPVPLYDFMSIFISFSIHISIYKVY